MKRPTDCMQNDEYFNQTVEQAFVGLQPAQQNTTFDQYRHQQQHPLAHGDHNIYGFDTSIVNSYPYQHLYQNHQQNFVDPYRVVTVPAFSYEHLYHPHVGMHLPIVQSGVAGQTQQFPSNQPQTTRSCLNSQGSSAFTDLNLYSFHNPQISDAHDYVHIPAHGFTAANQQCTFSNFISDFEPKLMSDADRKEDLRKFATDFKARRTRLGITQELAGKQLNRLGIPGFSRLSQSTICRFESQTLSIQNMEYLRPVLHHFLIWAEKEGASKLEAENDEYGFGGNRGYGENSKKRKRTPIGTEEKKSLEMIFHGNNKPNTEDITMIAKNLGLPKDTVRIWFCNQRQKQKRMNIREV
ncbi:hypothetical protein ACOME3_008519 [Neoechinorhynchus agilis]